MHGTRDLRTHEPTIGIGQGGPGPPTGAAGFWLPQENMALRQGKIILSMTLVLLLAGGVPVFGQATRTFTGKITEIAQRTGGTEFDVGRHRNFYILHLEEYPETGFRLSPEDAVRFGVIDPTGITGLLTPKKSKGLGWKVKLTCEGQSIWDSQPPTYRVPDVERLEN